MAASGRPRDVNRGRRANGPRRRLALAAVLVGTAALTPASAAAVPAPKLSWRPCAEPEQKGFECATARRVPLDYDNPRGGKIQLAVIRQRATDPGHRIGSLFYNPGGPGGAGTALPLVIDLFPAEVRARFDIVSWDPRGVGASTAVKCFASPQDKNEGAFLGGLVVGNSFPVGNAEMGKWIQRYRALGRRCERRSGGLLRHVSTTDTARDLNLLRRAVGDRRLSYLGVSYGTFLGATYANLFPDRVRALVLDGNLSPRAYVRPQLEANRGRFLTTDLRARADQSAAMTLNAFLDLCGSADPAGCALSAGSPAATRAKYADLLGRLRSSPPSAGRTYAELVSTTGTFLYSTAAWPSLANMLQEQWATGRARRPIAAPNAIPTQLIGQVFAIRCSESPNPRSAAFRTLDGFSFRRSGPLGPWWSWQSVACGSWPATAADRYTGPWDRRTANPVLVTGTTQDPSTPFRSSVAMARQLARARLLRVDGYGHTVFSNLSTCANGYVSRYLIDKALPPAGTTCEQDQVPFRSEP